MLGSVHSFVQGFVSFTVAGIETIVPCHFKMFFRDMLDQKFYKIQRRNSFFNVCIILVPVVMESDEVTIIGINPGSSNHRAAQITGDIFHDGIRVTEVRFCIDIETIFVFFIDGSLDLFKRGADAFFHFTQQGSLESLAQIRIVEVPDISPEAVIREATFRKEAVDMGIPMERTTKGMEDTDKAGDKVFGHIQREKHTEDDTADGLKETV